MLFWLSNFADAIPLFNVFRYITFRTGGAVVTAMLFVFLFGPMIIRGLRVRQGRGQPIREDGPQAIAHQKGHANDGRPNDPGRSHLLHAALG